MPEAGVTAVAVAAVTAVAAEVMMAAVAIINVIHRPSKITRTRISISFLDGANHDAI
jgi:hypothetical protein